MTNYARMYRLGLTPWERYGRASAAGIAAVLDREEAARPRPLGRALDLGCGRGQYTPELARRGWQAVGVDYVPSAIEAAKRRRCPEGVTYVVGDVTNLSSAALGTFDFFLDVGCFQGLDGEQRRAAGRGVSVLANPDATLLMLAFGPGRWRSVVGRVSQAEVETAFPGWAMLAVEGADTAGLGWPMRTTAPTWYRLRRLRPTWPRSDHDRAHVRTDRRRRSNWCAYCSGLSSKGARQQTLRSQDQQFGPSPVTISVAPWKG